MARYALVIGISHYDDKHFEILDKASTDAKAVVKILKKDKRYEVRQPLVDVVTGTKLGETLCQFLIEQADNNEALIYFTGHGFRVVDNVKITEGFLATSDCEVSLENGKVTNQKNGLSLTSLSKLFRESNLSNLVVILDACHSGEFLEKTLIQQSLTEFSSRTDYFLITGCRSFEQGVAKKREDHSVFTGALLEGLSQENANEAGEVRTGSLFDFISKKLRDEPQEAISMGGGRSITLLEYSSGKKAVEPIRDKQKKIVCPYQALKAFERDTEEFFFGREQLVRKLAEVLSQTSFIPIIGASGSGKSSVVKAGLIPHLEKLGGWKILETIKPGLKPLNELWKIFENYFRTKKDKARLENLIESEEDYSKILAEIIKKISDSNSDRFLLVVDQFEEVFTVCTNSAKQERFIRLITQVTKLSSSRLSVVITMRADFLESCLQYDALRQQIQEYAEYMPRLQGGDLREVISAPAERQGYTVAPALVDKILDDVGREPGILPLLEFALTMLWEKRDRKKGEMQLKQYKQLGGLQGALNQHADNVYKYRDFDQDKPSEHRSKTEQDWIKQIFIELVRVGEQEKDTRQRRRKTKLLELVDIEEQEDWRELLEGDQGLVRGRLLVTSGTETSKKTEDGWVELVHETLLEGWEQFADWRKEDRDQRRLIQLIRQWEREWQTKHNDSYLLLRGERLEAARDLAKKPGILNNQERHYVNACFMVRERERMNAAEQRLKNLSEMGWGVIFAYNESPDVIDALKELLDYRRKQATQQNSNYYHEFSGRFGYRPGDTKRKFLNRHNVGTGYIDAAKVPYYLLIVGDPEKIPYSFQYQLSVEYAVGRIHFDTPTEYAQYARSIVKAETEKVFRSRQVTFFGPNHKVNDKNTATYGRDYSDKTASSIEDLVDPLRNWITQDQPNWTVQTLLGEEATKARLRELLEGSEIPSLLFTTCLGMSFRNGDPRQLSHQGALICQDWPGKEEWGNREIPQSFYFSAEDLDNEKVQLQLHGLIAFLWGNYSAGTSQVEVNTKQSGITSQAFISSLPKRLLNHSDGGALAIIANVDQISLSSIWRDSIEKVTTLAVFKNALKNLMYGFPVGAAMKCFNIAVSDRLRYDYWSHNQPAYRPISPMPKAYSLDLRQKIVDAYDRGDISQRGLARQFGVAKSFIEKLLKQRRETGSIAPKLREQQTPPKLNAAHRAILAELVAETNDATLAELSDQIYDRTAVRVGITTMHTTLKTMGITVKKNIPSRRQGQ